MKQISIVVQNKPGVLAEITELMGEHKINITDIEAETFGETGVVVMSVDQYDAALKILRNASFRAITEDSLLLKLQDEPGALAKIAKRFSEANINIRSIHIVSREGGNSIVAVSTERTEEAMKLVEDILVA